MKLNSFETRERPPATSNRGYRTGAAAAIRATATSGQSVFFHCNGESPLTVQSRMSGWRTHFKGEGYKVRTRRGEDGVFIWLEPISKERNT